MSDIITALKDWGCDIEGALDRVLGDEKFYRSLLGMLTEDAAFDGLGEAIKNKDALKAFQYAHDLKGSLANMGITPLYRTVCEMVEPLRVGSFDGIAVSYDRLKEQMQEFRQLISE